MSTRTTGPNVAVRGIRASIPSGYILGRLSAGPGAAELIPINGQGGLGSSMQQSGSAISRLAQLQDVSLSALGDKQRLRYNLSSGKWVNVADTLANLTDVNTTGVLTGSLLQFSGTAWVPHTPLLSDDGDVAISAPSNLQVLQYNSGTGKWANATISVSATLAGLTDVQLTALADTNILSYNAASGKWKNIALGNGVSLKITVFTAAGTATWTPDPNMIYAESELLGGGAAGGGSTGNTSFLTAGGGGGSGAHTKKIISKASAGASQTVTVGAGGAGVVAGAGGNGGTSSIGTLATAPGGSGGAGGTSGSFGSGGAGGIPGTGDYSIPGNCGSTGPYNSGASGFVPTLGIGGAGPLGGQGPTALAVTTAAADGQPGVGAGSGGSGGCSNFAAGNSAGGNGKSGIVVIIEYIGTSGGGSSTLAGDTDVAITTPATGQILVYNSATSKWENKAKESHFLLEWNSTAQAGSTVNFPFWAGMQGMIPAGFTITHVCFYATAAAATSHVTPALYSVNANGTLNTLVASGSTVVGVTQGLNELPLTTPYVMPADGPLAYGMDITVAGVSMGVKGSSLAMFFSITVDAPLTTPAATTFGSQTWAGWFVKGHY